MMPATVTLFRPAALESRAEGADAETLAVATPWSWTVFALAAAILTTALILGMLLRVEVTGRARGAVVPVGGVRTIAATANGIVAEVFHGRGENVRAGDPLLRIDSAQTEAGVVAADGALAAERFASEEDSSFLRQRDALRTRTAIQREEVDSAARSVTIREATLKRRSALREAGLASGTDVDLERDAVEAARRQLGAARAQLVQTSQEAAALEEAHEARRRDRQLRIAQAAAGRNAAHVPLGQLVVRAGADGTIESLAARPGDVVATGAPLGRIVPEDGPLRIVCFLSQGDRRFVHIGAIARIELDELPRIEFGTVPARVIAISRDLATEGDVHTVLAGTDPPAAVYRLELEPLANGGALRAGMLLHARFVLRRERPLALLFAPLRRWAG
jgi:multidrug resistance efflux pump